MPLPEYTKFKEAALIPKSVVNEVRDRFLEEVAKSVDEYYAQDIDRIKTNDWHVSRFIADKKNNVDEAIKALVEANKWRKSFGVRELKSSDFPKEFFQCGGGFVYGTDLEGSKIIIVRAKVNRKIKSWVPTLRRFGVWIGEQIDQNFDGKGLTAVLHCKGAGLKNVDLDSMQFALKVARDYYPGLLKVALCHKLPAILEPVFKTVISWLKDDEKNLIHITNKKNINEYVAIEQLPDFMLGTNTLSYRVVPDDAPPAVELAKTLSLKEGKAEKLIKHLEPFFTD